MSKFIVGFLKLYLDNFVLDTDKTPVVSQSYQKTLSVAQTMWDELHCDV